MEEEKKQLLSDIEQERKRMQEREQEMKETIQKYEERSTKDILSIKQLANQVASLQNKQKVIGTTDEKTEEEIFSLKTKIQQLTNQKIALEKNLTEKLTNNRNFHKGSFLCLRSTAVCCGPLGPRYQFQAH